MEQKLHKIITIQNGIKVSENNLYNILIQEQNGQTRWINMFGRDMVIYKKDKIEEQNQNGHKIFIIKK